MDLVGGRFSKSKFLSSIYFPGIRPDQVLCSEALRRALLSRFSQTQASSMESSEHSRVRGQEDQTPTFYLPAEPCLFLEKEGRTLWSGDMCQELALLAVSA